MKIGFFVSTVVVLTSFIASADVNQTKAEILRLANLYQGQGDPDGSKQKSIEPLVETLLTDNPQAPIRDRLPLLYGAWKQVWGPYDYRGTERGVDPKIDPTTIYQVVFEGGYYYNVNYSLNRNKEIESTDLLRGEFVLDAARENTLNVRFTSLRRIEGTPSGGLRLQDLPELSEAGRLPGEFKALPDFLVRLLFGGGSLNEVYTDDTLRILFGTSRNGTLKNYLYVLERAPL